MRNGLEEQEVQIINSIIDLKNIKIKDVMIKLEKAFILYEEDIVNDSLIKKISLYNFSKIPIFNKKKLCTGFINTKELLNVSVEDKITIGKLVIKRKPLFI